tara:strand:+ start:159 stop:983 length:825 start_codon:yes stop_codon:yes gene_type:complete
MVKMAIWRIILISFFLSCFGFCYSQDNRLPNWDKTHYKWEKRPLRWTALSNKPAKIVTELQLNKNNEFKFQHTVYSPNYHLTLFKLELVPMEQYIDSGTYEWIGDTIVLSYMDSTRLYKQKGITLKQLETNTNKKLTYSIPRRIGVGVHYGPEAIAVSINSEFFPFRKKNIFLGIEAGLFIIHLNIGTHIGYQKNFLLSQIDLDYSLYGNNDFFSVNPKIGLMKFGLYFKTGPSIVIKKERNNILNADFVKVLGVPLNFEIGYCYKINSKYFDF